MNRTFVWGEVRELPENESREVVFVASDATRDRHKSVLNPQKWQLENFNRNPITGYMHNLYGDMCNAPDPDDVLGPARSWVDGNELMVAIDFEPADLNPKADKIFRKIKNGTLRAVSVGFLELGKGTYGKGEEARGKTNETYYFNSQELLEVSVVNIPSNPKAVKKSLLLNTNDAMAYVVRALGGNYSLSEIDNMKVSEIRKLIVGDRTVEKHDDDKGESSEEEIPIEKNTEPFEKERSELIEKINLKLEKNETSI